MKETTLGLVNCTVDFFLGERIGANSGWFKEYISNRQMHFIKQLDRWKNTLPTPPAQILDIGAAPFLISECLSRLGYTVNAVDLNPGRFDNLDKLKCKIIKGDGENPNSLSLENNKFDVVILSHVFEHFRYDLISSLKGIRKLLKPRGQLILETPNLLSFIGWYSLLFKGVAYSSASSIYHEWSKIEKLGHMGHVREYSAIELRELLEKSGFNVKSVIYSELKSYYGIKSIPIRFIQSIIPKLRMNLSVIAYAN